MNLDIIFTSLYKSCIDDIDKIKNLDLQPLVDLKDPATGNTLLHLAIAQLNKECLELQPYFGTDGTKRTRAADQYAKIYKGTVCLVQLTRKLLESGANIFHKNHNEQTVYDYIEEMQSLAQPAQDKVYLDIVRIQALDQTVDARFLPTPTGVKGVCLLTKCSPLEQFRKTYATETVNNAERFNSLNLCAKNQLDVNLVNHLAVTPCYRTGDGQEFSSPKLSSINGDFKMVQHLAAKQKADKDAWSGTVEVPDVNYIMKNLHYGHVTAHSSYLLKTFKIHGHTKTTQEIIHAEKQSKIRAALVGFNPSHVDPTSTIRALAALLKTDHSDRKLMRHPCKLWDPRTWIYSEIDTNAYKQIVAVLTAFNIAVPPDGFAEPKMLTVEARTTTAENKYTSAELTALDNLGVYAGLAPGYFTRLTISDTQILSPRLVPSSN